ncbi:unnamed protein product, partial [Meganyctiphanes norvegica]
MLISRAKLNILCFNNFLKLSGKPVNGFKNTCLQKNIPSFILYSQSSCQLSTTAWRYNEKQPPKRENKMQKMVPVTWKSLVTTGIIGAGLLAFMFYVKKEKEIAIQKERQRALGKARIGGTFELVDYNGKQVKSEDFLGQWVLLYFGFTNCPDVCPDELEKMGKVVDIIDGLEKVPNIQPLFITVDPQRDTQKMIKEYVAEFHPKFIGMTGTIEQISQACKAYRVYFSAGPRDEDDDYIVDHTIIIYLINPDGEFVDYYGQTKDAAQVSSSVALNMKKYEQQNKKGLLGNII